jgi:hypothetical protein
MLVLAMQFSKGRERETAGSRGAGVLLQRTQRTEETTARRTLGDREVNLRPINDELDGHQCTNWESVRLLVTGPWTP